MSTRIVIKFQSKLLLFLYSFLFLFNGLSVYVAFDQYNQVQRKVKIVSVLYKQYQLKIADSSEDDDSTDDESSEPESEYPQLTREEAVATLTSSEEPTEESLQDGVETSLAESSYDDDFQFLSEDEEKILAQAKQELAQYRQKIAVERVKRQSGKQQTKNSRSRQKQTSARQKARTSSVVAKKRSAADSERVRIPSMAYVKKRAVTNAFFDWPIDLSSCWLSSPYGMRKHPRGGKKFHAGIDLAAMRGTPVMASASGVIVQAQYVAGYGNNIIVSHNNRFKTRYAHLHKMYVKPGQTVEQGQKIGAVGATGYVRKSGRDGSHLHFEIYSDGRHVNPLKYLLNE